MSALLLPALAAGSSGQGALYVDDVFSTYLYTGNGSAQTINNGIDLAGKGGLVWTKGRGAQKHRLIDSARGLSSITSTDDAVGNYASTSGYNITSFNNNGYTLGLNEYSLNSTGTTLVSWTFRRAPKFFDVVTYTGDGVNGRQIAHNLGIKPGVVIVKRTDATGGDWVVGVSYNDHANAAYLLLNSTAATPQQTNGYVNSFTTTSSYFCVNQGGMANLTAVNANGAKYVAYIFAHDPSADGIIRCGSFTTDSSGNATVNLGWANGSQFAMIKAASTAGDWEMYDTARTSAWSGNDARLRANLSSAEDSVARISTSGTSITFAGLSANSTHIYMAIRSPS